MFEFIGKLFASLGKALGIFDRLVNSADNLAKRMEQESKLLTLSEAEFNERRGIASEKLTLKTQEQRSELEQLKAKFDNNN